MAGLWDLYLDVDDASPVLHAAAVLERRDAIREPLPLDDAARLLDRLRTVARIAKEEATFWGYETEDRRAELDVDGGRWGSTEVARTMLDIAIERAAGCHEVADAADAAVADLAVRLRRAPLSEVQEAVDATVDQAQRLLRTGTLDAD